MKKGIKKTELNYVVDMDEYFGRERFYTGSWAGVKLAFPIKSYPENKVCSELDANHLYDKPFEKDVKTICRGHKVK